MDGANYIQILARIIVPLSKPVIATIALWHAVWHWNEWLYALIFLNDESLLVLQRLLRRMLLELTQVEEALIDRFESVEEVRLPSAALRAAVTIITIGPIILLYPFVQKYFIKGIFIGSLKG
jgi:putative aldouronate transport system permease protein